MTSDNLLPEQKARLKIDKQLTNAGWDIVSRDEYIPNKSLSVKEALMTGNKESDYLFFIDNKAIAVLEAKREENTLGKAVADQAEYYASHPKEWYSLYFPQLVPLVYLGNGDKLYFKNMLRPEGEYEEISAMHSPKEMLRILNLQSEYGALPRIEKRGLRECQYDAEVTLEKSFKGGKKRALAVLATGSGKTYLACLASYRLMNYTPVRRILFLVDRNNLARQTESEFNKFDRTENGMPLSSLYQITRLRRNEDIKGDVVISTIQKLFAVMKGESLVDTNEDSEDEGNFCKDDVKEEKPVELGNVILPPDYFQFIVVDECHRSIYGKWRSVLEYFTGAKVLGLTATPTPEAYAFFNNNVVETYSYDDSVADGVNVPARVYRIQTAVTDGGGEISRGTEVADVSKSSGNVSLHITDDGISYSKGDLDRSVVNHSQILTVLSAFRDAVYSDLYPEREEMWEYVPKTLIFAKSDRHADEIVDAVKQVFSGKFGGQVPFGFVQKITYSAGDSNELIRSLRTEKNFRIAVTVTLVATGTDVKPLEIVMFMADVQSAVLYTQMRGRGCRTISGDRLREVTPNAAEKECFYIVDAVGVTEHDKTLVRGSAGGKKGQVFLPLDALLEQLAYGNVTDNNLMMLSHYCSTINSRYEHDALFGHHLDEFIEAFHISLHDMGVQISNAVQPGKLPAFVENGENRERKQLISDLIENLPARKKLLELRAGYYALPDDPDELLYAGFSVEEAKSFIAQFEQYLAEHKDSVEALRIIYNSEDVVITHSMLVDLRDKLSSANRAFTPLRLWRSYRVCHPDEVDEPDLKHDVNALTNLIQIVRYAFHKTGSISSLFGSFASRFNLYCGQEQRSLSEDQVRIMQKIAEYVVSDGAISVRELNEIDTDLWRAGIRAFTAPVFDEEIMIMSKFILKESAA